MTKEEISRIKTHIEIHARRERGAVIITQILRKAVDELEHIAELEKENAELKEENKKWKDEWQEQVQEATEEGYARTLQTIQLTKAKELLAKWVELFKPKGGNMPPTPIQVKTEQFLSEVEK